MDKITKSLLDTFIQEQNLAAFREPEAFEYFSCFSIVSSEYNDDFDLEEVIVGSGNDTGIDGIAIIVNGNIVTSEEEVADLLEINGYLEVHFIFVQATTSSNFDGGKLSSFAFGVRDFFSDKPVVPRNDDIQRASAIKEAIYQLSAHMTKGNPNITMYYVCTGSWQNDPALTGRIENEKEALNGLNIFRLVRFVPIDAPTLQDSFKRTRIRSVADISFEKHIALPEIGGVTEAYIGFIPGTEYLKMIRDQNGLIQKSLFYDNVRDFQGENLVNKEIAQTIASGELDQFVVRNNGVTVVAKKLYKTGNKFRLEEYQVVNGCQTSHVLFNEEDKITDDLVIPIKIVVTSSDDVIFAMIKSSNRQTAVKPEELEALSHFQKRLEDYYKTFDGDKVLYYERRSRQYAQIAGIEKTRIITIPYQIRYFAAMFLDEPHRAGRYYSTLLKQIGGQVFGTDHMFAPYYTSGYAAYKLDWLFRNTPFDKRFRVFRYHLLMGFRHLAGEINTPPFNAKAIEAVCGRLNEKLWSADNSLEIFERSAKCVDLFITKYRLALERDTARTQTFTDYFKTEISRLS